MERNRTKDGTPKRGLRPPLLGSCSTALGASALAFIVRLWCSPDQKLFWNLSWRDGSQVHAESPPRVHARCTPCHKSKHNACVCVCYRDSKARKPSNWKSSTLFLRIGIARGIVRKLIEIVFLLLNLNLFLTQKSPLNALHELRLDMLCLAGLVLEECEDFFGILIATSLPSS